VYADEVRLRSVKHNGVDVVGEMNVSSERYDRRDPLLVALAAIFEPATLCSSDEMLNKHNQAINP